MILDIMYEGYEGLCLMIMYIMEMNMRMYRRAGCCWADDEVAYADGDEYASDAS